MKNVLRLLTLVAALGALVLPALAQDPAAGQPAASAQDAEARAALYAKFYDNYNKTPEQQKIAYEAGKEYVAKYGSDQSADNVTILNFINKWLPKYEKAVRDFEFAKALEAKDYANAFRLGRQIMTAEPENTRVALELARIGYINTVPSLGGRNDPAIAGEAVRATRQAIQMLEAGKTPDKWVGFANKDEALGWLYYFHGIHVIKTSPDEAAQAFLKVAQTPGPAQREPGTFINLANAYLTGEYKRAEADFKACCEGKEVTPEIQAKLDGMYAIVDRVIDAYARAIALSTKPEQAAHKQKLMAELTNIYKQRHNDSDAGLQDLIANVLSKPLPKPGDPVTPSTPAANTTGGNTAAANGVKPAATPATTTQPATAKPAAAQPTTTPAAKPPANNMPPKPRTK
jgi:hypothetical protein